MKFKEFWKRFLTLNRHHAEGFTLVELIVVIAILAILGAVAVPAYNGYIKKANMTADQTLVSDIEHALTLAGYSGTFAEGEGGYLVLSTEGIDGIEDGSKLDTAMKAAFGEGYKDALKLKYDEWGSNGLLDGMKYENAYAVTESNYMNGKRTGALLGDVEKITKMAADVVSVLNGATSIDASLSNMFNSKADVLGDAASKYNIAIDNKYKDANGKVDWDAWGDENETAYGNLLVLAAAEEAEKTLTDETYEMSEASILIMSFANYYAYAAQNETFSGQLDNKLAELDSLKEKENPIAAGGAWFKEVDELARDAGFDSYVNDENESNQYNIDKGAFLSIMAGLGNPTDEQAALIAADLSNPNLFSQGVVNDMYNEYLATVNAVYNMGEGFSMPKLTKGEIAIFFAQENGAPVIATSMPTA